MTYILPRDYRQDLPGPDTFKIVGIDPGSDNVGLAVLEIDIKLMLLVKISAKTITGRKMFDHNSWEVSMIGERAARIKAIKQELINFFIQERPISIACESPFFNPCAFAFERAGHPRHHHIRQASFLQKIQKVPVKEPAVRPHRPQPRSLRQQREGLLQERDDPARRAGVPAAQPAVQHERDFRQHCQQWMMTLTPGATRIVALGCALLMTSPLEHRRIQIQRESCRWRAEHCQEPDPERSPETLDRALCETVKQRPHRVGTGPARQTEQRVQRPVGTRYLGVSEATRATEHTNQERGERMGQWDGVGAGQHPRQMLL